MGFIASERDDEDGIDPFAWDWHVPWHAYVPSILLVVTMALLWLLNSRADGMRAWGVSGATLAQGHLDGVGLHMFAHANLTHITINSTALLAVGAPIVARLGEWPLAWLRFSALYLLSGLAAMITFLVFHPNGQVPMLGASGAIYGLVGFILRIKAFDEGSSRPLTAGTRQAIVALIKENLFLIALLTVSALLFGLAGGLAWEAHLGGFLFGLLLAPRLFLSQSSRGPSSRTDAIERQ